MLLASAVDHRRTHTRSVFVSFATALFWLPPLRLGGEAVGEPLGSRQVAGGSPLVGLRHWSHLAGCWGCCCGAAVELVPGRESQNLILHERPHNALPVREDMSRIPTPDVVLLRLGFAA